MADVNVQAIQGNPPKPLDPLTMLGGWQDYANKVQQGANLKLANQTGQQSLAQTMVQRHNQIMFGLINTPDAQLPDAAKQALDSELATGQIDPQRHAVMSQQLQQLSGNPSALREQISRGLVANLSGPEALAALSPKIANVDAGGTIQPQVQPSPLQAATNPAGMVVSNIPGTIQKSLPPQLAHTGGGQQPVGGAYGTPASLPQTLTPAEATTPETRDVYNPTTKQIEQVTKTRGEWNNPALLAPAMKVGGGAYPTTTKIEGTTPAQLKTDQTAFANDSAQVQPLTTGTQSLSRALDALNSVSTGAGTEGLARMRALATSFANVAGVDLGLTGQQDKDRAILTKYLTKYAIDQASSGRSDEALTSAFKANASGEINNAAAQEVVRTNIGRDRQSIATNLAAPNQENGAGYQNHKKQFQQDTDPHGFAWDTYTPSQRAQIAKDAQGKYKNPMDSPAYQKLARSINIAKQLNLIDLGKQLPDNVNANQ